jgi:hypothetical protein
VVRKKILHYRQLYIDRPEPIAFMPVAVDTSGHIYDDFLGTTRHRPRQASDRLGFVRVEFNKHNKHFLHSCITHEHRAVELLEAHEACDQLTRLGLQLLAQHLHQQHTIEVLGHRRPCDRVVLLHARGPPRH